MDDPVLIKLKTDAAIVLVDLWRALSHQPPVEEQEWRNPRVEPVFERKNLSAGGKAGAKPSGLCYFHLN
jgi:hypothetical protein